MIRDIIIVIGIDIIEVPSMTMMRMLVTIPNRLHVHHCNPLLIPPEAIILRPIRRLRPLLEGEDSVLCLGK